MDILSSVPSRSADPHLREKIINTAAQLLATEGAVSARRLARQLGTSTMVVYTHFGGMDELTRQVMRRGFADFGTELDRGAVTDDAVADWMTYLWSYRRFALREPHLYGVMFGPGLAAFRLGDPADLEAARSTFVSLLRRIHACLNAARWEVDDVTTAGEAVWSGVHGHTTLELTGFFGSVGRDPVRSYSEILTRMSIGLGDDALATARSLSTARRRAARADRAEAASPAGVDRSAGKQARSLRNCAVLLGRGFRVITNGGSSRGHASRNLSMSPPRISAPAAHSASTPRPAHGLMTRWRRPVVLRMARPAFTGVYLSTQRCLSVRTDRLRSRYPVDRGAADLPLGDDLRAEEDDAIKEQEAKAPLEGESSARTPSRVRGQRPGR
jgi:AcrR family transcriptional regulator